MATTTNYGWTTPDDTALVKDGASAIRTLGSSVDTTVKNLNPETTLGDISYRSSTANTNTRLALGTAGQVLTVNSGGTAPEWANSSSGGMTLLATATPSAATTIQFTSISGSYKSLYLVWRSVFQSATGYFGLRFNGDTGSNYRTTTISNANGTLTQFNETTAQTSIGRDLETAPISLTGTTDTFIDNCYGVMIIPEYSNTTVRKYVEYKSISWARYPHTAQGIWDSTSAITQIDFVRNTTQTITGTMYLYGVQ